MNEANTFDDFGEHNKVIHPELLAKLSEEFIKYEYKPKLLLEWICNSDAYQLSNVANTTNNKTEHEAFFSRMLMKSMAPEVLFESLMEATKAEVAADKDARKEAKEAWMNKLVRNFGDDEGNEMTFNGTVIQALLMMNGRELNDEVSRKTGGSAVALALKKYTRGNVIDHKSVIDELYLSALGRRASTTNTLKYTIPAINPKAKPTVITTSEQAMILNELSKVNNPKDPKPDPNAVANFYEDLFWTLLNTNEFILNH
jgi:hypothetical protein